MCSDFLIHTIAAQQEICDLDKNAIKQIKISCEKMNEEDFNYIYEQGYRIEIDYESRCDHLDPRVFPGNERDSFDEMWIISWNK